ncbi:hypothetical protein L1987_69685 [Smallanthus sonchifolius]|uniref:Uncharacterized protein n=1 Tax=Smallanthus sonchifolius TaxID=185202 RepID=A0ACB9B6W3_9ASTR|nr:hypothetical protein L1987_69685 [Smallanthus sonchifolius]
MTPQAFAHLTLAFGLLGNVVSFMVFLSPLPTFYKVYKKKSTEGYQSVPYVVGLFSAMLWIYYALLKSNAMLLITINSVGCFIQTFYIFFFLFYAPKKARIESLKLIGLMIRQVIKTKSVEYMPILLSVALTLNAVTWFFYGLLLHDFNIAIPNVLGFTFGILQMTLYFVYKNKKPVSDEKVSGIEIKNKTEEHKIPETKDQEIIDIVKLSALICSVPVVAKLNENNNVVDDHLVVDPPLITNHTIEVAA